jgi:predicted patatin/cPLA2 family phospholipase
MSETIYGVNPGCTIDLLKDRALRRSRGDSSGDGRKAALIVEGGAMRGVISCAALMGLEELGMTNVFDDVYGASAGAVNAAYFLAGQAAYATTIYYQKINNTRFIRRFWSRKIVDLDDLFDSIIAGERPLYVDRVLQSKSRLFITIGDASTGEAFLVEARPGATSLLTLLKASAAMPLFYNQLVCVDGRDCFDGALINPLPVLEAIEAGCTDLLVVLTRPASFRDRVPSRIERHIFDSRCARGNVHMMRAFRGAFVRENAVRDLALGRQSVPDGINIATICPDETDPRVERTTRSGDILKAAAIASARHTLRAFGRDADEFVEVLRAFPPVHGAAGTPVPQSDDSTLTAA